MLDEAVARGAARFGRAEPRRIAGQFVEWLLSGVERKTCWSVAERAGHADPQAMQRMRVRRGRTPTPSVMMCVDWLVKQFRTPRRGAGHR